MCSLLLISALSSQYFPKGLCHRSLWSLQSLCNPCWDLACPKGDSKTLGQRWADLPLGKLLFLPPWIFPNLFFFFFHLTLFSSSLAWSNWGFVVTFPTTNFTYVAGRDDFKKIIIIINPKWHNMKSLCSIRLKTKKQVCFPCTCVLQRTDNLPGLHLTIISRAV